MSTLDKQKWDKKYVDKPQLLRPRDASAVLKEFLPKGEGKIAIDLACGSGRNSLYLAQNGYVVDAVDIAAIAMDALKAEALRSGLSEKVIGILQDLDTFNITPERYDLVLMSNFLDRGLIERSKAGLKKGGCYIVETYMSDEMNEKENSKASNLLEAGELRSIFSEGYKIVHYDEYENEDYEIYRMKKQVIVVEKL